MTALVCVGCAGQESSKSLRTDDAVGGVSLIPYDDVPRDRWAGSFGARYLCSDEPVTITSVSPEWTQAPVEHTFHVQTVRSAAELAEDAAGWSFYSAFGSAPAFEEQYSSEKALPGDVVPAEGAGISAPCPPATGFPFQVLLLSAEVDAAGAELTGLTLDYRDEDGATGRLDLSDWDLVLCGTTTPPDACS